MQRQRPYLKRQQGLTLISWLFVMAIIGFFVLLTLRMFPIYTNHFSIQGSLKSLSEERDLYQKTREDVLTLLERRMQINRVVGFKREYFTIDLKNNGNKVFKIAYEDRRTIMGNVDVVVKFSDEIIVTQSGTVIGL
jgi:hypothetical protein